MKETWGVWAVRSAGSVCGAAAAWVKKEGKVWHGTEAEAREYAKRLNSGLTTLNVHYCPQSFLE